MTSTTSVVRGPTTTTLRTIEKVLAEAAVPMSRYEIRKRLGFSVGAALLDEALGYMAEHELVFDEGTGGRVLWIRASAATRSRLA